MARKAQPYDIEALKRAPQPEWPVQYVSDVLMEIYNRENGTNIRFKATPKEPSEGGLPTRRWTSTKEEGI